MNTVQMEVHAGAQITTAIGQAISLANARNAMVEFEFNTVKVQVNHDSDHELIYRDWSRAMSGYTSKEVGPYPNYDLSEEEKASDAEIKARKEKERAEACAKREAEKQIAREELEAKIANFSMSRDEGKWQKSIAAQNGQEYGLAIFRFAERWARLMEAELAEGKTLSDIASATADEADIEGISGFMYGAAVCELANAWKHGEALRQWHNGEYNVPSDAKGVVNPAILTIK
mgnify:CR=1 FL=1